MFEDRVPATRQEMRTALLDQRREIADYLAGFSDEAFFAPQGEHWSPAGHVRHLNKSVRAVANGVKQSRVALLVFGRSSSGSRPYEEVVGIYHEALEAGGQAGPYGPSDRKPDLTPEAWRLQIMEHWEDSCSRLGKAVLGWSESQLDVYRLPHPLIGKLTLRELLWWNLYHNLHHVRRIAERAEGEPAGTAGTG